MSPPTGAPCPSCTLRAKFRAGMSTLIGATAQTCLLRPELRSELRSSGSVMYLKHEVPAHECLHLSELQLKHVYSGRSSGRSSDRNSGSGMSSPARTQCPSCTSMSKYGSGIYTSIEATAQACLLRPELWLSVIKIHILNCIYRHFQTACPTYVSHNAAAARSTDVARNMRIALPPSPRVPPPRIPRFSSPSCVSGRQKKKY